MRKNLLASVTGHDVPKADSETRANYAARGASRSMMVSIDEMAENAKRMAAGETIVSLDAHLIDGSFVSDRMAGDDHEYELLREAIRAHGQSSPILVRPHPEHDGRYMIVFGHRRARVARELAIPVRAVVKKFEDIAHIVAQGQENAARANLSFIEKALFAKKLLDMGQSKDTIKSALTVDDTLLSRMLSVAEGVPLPIIEAIGAAKGIGRDRWEDLKKQVTHPVRADLAREVIKSDGFKSKDGADRFNHLLAELKAKRTRPRKGGAHASSSGAWSADGKLVEAVYRDTGKIFSLSLRSKDASEFGRFISSSLESLYRAFKEAKAQETGD